MCLQFSISSLQNNREMIVHEGSTYIHYFLLFEKAITVWNNECTLVIQSIIMISLMTCMFSLQVAENVRIEQKPEPCQKG